ncbi:uncharacterized protein LOC143220867 isoform X2 [Lasioglossum baleicum]|uniref:uncharacterized protein LOC143220867 isoform X2 n=1 Tax=Lasioglossum baleicum TaxID=434251 RepID=UPI003FCEB7FB
MATSNPAQSMHLKSPRSPRKLPQLPPIPIDGQRSPTQLSVTKTHCTPLVFEFPPEYNPETPNTNFDFEEFGRLNEVDRSPRSPGYYARSRSSNRDLLNSPGRKSPTFQFCEPRKILGKTMSYPPKSPISGPPAVPARSSSPSNYGPKSPKHRRNSCFEISGSKSPLSTTMPSPKYSKLNLEQSQNSPPYKNSSRPSSVEGSFKDRSNSPAEKKPTKKSSHYNRSQGCLDEAGKGQGKENDVAYGTNTSKRSTSDLSEMEDADTEVTLLSSPRRRDSIKSGLAYLASRRSSRDSQCSNLSNVSNEDVGPLNYTSHPRGEQRRTSNFLELPVPDHIRPRVHSLPESAYNPRSRDDLYRLREFSITQKGIVNRGDSIISRRSRSNTSVNSRNSNVSGERSPLNGSCCSGRGVSTDSMESDETAEVPKYRVVLLGESGVGKTALVSQFMTSEYINTYDVSLDDEFGEKTVSVLLDGDESEVVFIDHPHVEMSVENSLLTYEPHACIVVYSIVCRASFQIAEEVLNYLSQEHYTKERTVIVVGNKSDLERCRAIASKEEKLTCGSSTFYNFVRSRHCSVVIYCRH